MNAKIELRLERRGEVVFAIAEAGSIATVMSLEAARARVVSYYWQHLGRAIVVDATRIIPALTPLDWSAFKASGPSVSLPRTLPVAIVVADAYLDCAEEYSEVMANAGRRRFCFTELSAAWRWAAARTDHWPWAPKCLADACPWMRGVAPARHECSRCPMKVQG